MARRSAGDVVAIASLAIACGAAPDQDADATSSTTTDATSTGATSSGPGDDADTGGRVVPVDLVFPDLWSPDRAADPMSDHAPGEVACDVGFGDELGVFEVDTGLCNYAVFTQPAATEIFRGERVELTFTHDELVAPEPAVGHVAVAIGDTVVYSAEVAIPGPYDIEIGTWIASDRIAVGTPIVLHLHNHGVNNWRVVSITAEAP